MIEYTNNKTKHAYNITYMQNLEDFRDTQKLW